jgi:glycosidase
MLFSSTRMCSVIVVSVVLFGCNDAETDAPTVAKPAPISAPIPEREAFYGTTQAFSKNAIYFLMTDRFVDGDSSNNRQDQGGDYPTFDQPLISEDGSQQANVGYLGGDFKGILNNAEYIANMGFGAIWFTPFVDNPDAAFAGGEPITFGGQFKDGGKTGYHGYWANNFYKEDEHYPSADLNFNGLSQALTKHDLKIVIDIVANHGSPAFDMPEAQPEFGKLYDSDGKLIADHQNLPPEQLSEDNPLHDFFRRTPDIMQLSNLDDTHPKVKDYLIDSYLYWLEQGGAAIRVDTIKHVPHPFWKEMSDRVRAEYPDIFIFAESFDYNANFIAQHTLPKNGGISVLDFPMQSALQTLFEDPQSDYADLLKVLYLTHGPYHNPYDLVTFYDNHDMKRMGASDQGFIDAHNWLFTSRGIPTVYYGSEIGFMRGTKEHEGNRNYFGQNNIEQAKQHPIHQALTRIAKIRQSTPALQQGLQLNVEFSGQQASFYRILQQDTIAQTALVLLNKGDQPADFVVDSYMQAGEWTELLSGNSQQLAEGQALQATVDPHSVAVWLRQGEITDPNLISQLRVLMQHK